ncbi:hypothetical protein [Mycolicibacterium nivoides]|uniref:Uncharacterized protein n=1 Tax=Mycolicibacterium nivoides TaxID=2487344 RepID=A0ABW9L751_9MYCO
MTAPANEIPWSELYQPPTRDKALELVARSLAGPWPGPNRLVLAVILADNLLRIAERDGHAWWVDA